MGIRPLNGRSWRQCRLLQGRGLLSSPPAPFLPVISTSLRGAQALLHSLTSGGWKSPEQHPIRADTLLVSGCIVGRRTSPKGNFKKKTCCFGWRKEQRRTMPSWNCECLFMEHFGGMPCFFSNYLGVLTLVSKLLFHSL